MLTRLKAYLTGTQPTDVQLALELLSGAGWTVRADRATGKLAELGTETVVALSSDPDGALFVRTVVSEPWTAA